MTRAEWDGIVTDMVEERGAYWLTPDQQRIIIEYLTKNYGS
jgi:hypothetical protein